MKERMRLEKVNKTGNQSETGQGKKRKDAGNTKEMESKKKKLQKQKADKENLEKAKEKEERKKKKEEEKERQDFLLETRKSQAAARWALNQQRQSEPTTAAAEKNHTTAGEFSPLPLRVQNSTAVTRIDLSALSTSTPTRQPELQEASSSSSSNKSDRSSTLPRSPLLAAARQSPTLSVASEESPRPLQQENTCSSKDKTPRRRTNKERTNCDTRRGLHFQSSVVESSSEDEDVTDTVQDNPEVPHGNCCREQRLENEALRNRLQKLNRRLDIACKGFQFLCLTLTVEPCLFTLCNFKFLVFQTHFPFLQKWLSS